MSYTDTNPAPNYHLKINGATMGPKFMKLVTGAQFDDEASLISSLSFSLRYRELFQGGVAENILNSPIIAPGNLVVLRGGYGTDLVDIGAGYITEVEPDFAENDEPVINFKCYDQLHRQRY